MTYRAEAVCTCSGGAPWPAMTRLAVGGWNRYYLCAECKAIREEVCTREGLIRKIRFHKLDSESLSETVKQQAQRHLDLLNYEQLGLFGNTR